MALWDVVLGRTITLEIMEDNQATMKVVEKGYSAKLRHVSRTHKVDLSSIKEVLDMDNVKLLYVETKLQCADFFTKCLPPCAWDNAIALLGMFTEDQLQSAFPDYVSDSNLQQ